ncbi:MAG: hypothetical protein QOH08_93 [Chloroflexota bacterium]|jgi:hypothetical protein|nr:hypothetical protein [Chloroflexota bacterium]
MLRQVVSAAAAVAIAACAAPAASAPPASPTSTIVRITADEAARAMADDRFFSAYGQATLVISGRVGDVTASGSNNTRIALATSGTAVVICEAFGAPAVTAGDSIQVRVRATDALRDDAGVLLRSCEVARP